MAAASLETSSIIDKVVGQLTDRADLFPQPYKLIMGLRRIQRFIKYAESEVAVQLWSQETTELAKRLEFLTSVYLPHLTSSSKWGASFTSEILDIIDKLEQGKRAAELDLKEGWTSERSDFYWWGEDSIDFDLLPEGRWTSERSDFYWLEEDSRYIIESEVVGVDSHKEQLLSLLVPEPNSTRLAIALVGFGGIGKTTLASVVYRNAIVEQDFDCFAWINVSRSYDLEEILRYLTTQIFEAAGDSVDAEMDMMKLEELSDCLNEYLAMKRYVIVFDDVWQAEFWQDMKNVLPNSNQGSRIIITTRNNGIADSCDIVQNLQPLSEQSALRLFCKRAFRFEFEDIYPPEIEELTLEFVRRCHGFPLVIRTVADFLSAEKVISEWRKRLQQFTNAFEEMPFFSRVASVIFFRSYADLPEDIRPCFSYFGVFPKDYLVPDLKLFQLWIAENFVQEEMGKTLEQVAATYLNELIIRNLVQVSYINYYGTERICRVHPLVHDIILSKAEQLAIHQVLNERSRRLSIYGNMNNILKTIAQSQVRPTFRFLWGGKEKAKDGDNELMSKSLMMNLFKRFKLLELLDFENASLGYLPNEVGNLSYLKYLCLRNTKVKKLPKSIGLLLNLQTLDVRNTLIHELPIQILKLQKLRHLLASTHNDKLSMVDSIHGVRINTGIGFLEKLQTLLTVDAHSSGFGFMEELEKLRQMRWLGISKLTAATVNALYASIEKMNHLESLSLYSAKTHEVFDLEVISSPPPSLRRLILKCRLEKLPNWISKLQNLCVLGISFSRLAVDSLKALYCLPNLESLWLHQAYIGEQLHFEEGSFQKLKQLVLTELYDLRMMRIEEGALPLLEELRIGPSPGELSCDIQHLRNLQVLEYYDMPRKFILRLHPEGGSDYWKVQHVPSIRFLYRIDGRRYMSYKLGEPELLEHFRGFASYKDVISQREVQLSFYYSDDDDDSAPTSSNFNRLSFSSNRLSHFSDDIED